MAHYKFDQIAFNITDKKMPEPGDEKMYVGLEHLDSGSLKVTRWGSEVELKGQKLVMRKGDILFGRRNTYLRRAAIAPHDGIFSAHGMIFRPKTDVIDPEYFPFFISSNYFMDAAIRISVGSLSPTVNWKTLKEIEFDIPTLEEQRKNAALLSTINETKEAYQELLFQTDNLVKSQFIEMFGDPLSENCCYKKISILDACDNITGGGTPSKKHPEYYEGSIPWVSPKDMNTSIIEDSQDHITEEAITKSTTKLIPEQSVLMVIRSGVLKHDLPIAINKVPVTINQDMKAFLVGSKIIPQYLFGYFKTIEADVLRGVRAVTADNIEFKVFQKRLIQIPPMDEQQKFAEFMVQSDKSKFELKEAIQSCDALMKAILFTNLEEKED